MNKNIERFIMALIAISIGVNFYFDKKGFERDVEAAQKLEQFNHGLLLKNIYLETRIDSLKEANAKIVQATIYIDSCQASKVQKADRAERRGRFVGGILRGLIPGI
jgi:hypothetical protein